jgi:predicted Fe-Mo cluster-binding NifX family protein
MKIAISILHPRRDTVMDPRFGRAYHFAIYDTESKSLEFVSNTEDQPAHGAGVETSRMLLDMGLQKAISGAFGPNAAQVLGSAGIEMESIPNAAAVSLESILALLD